MGSEKGTGHPQGSPSTLPGLPPVDPARERRERADRERPTVVYEPTPLGVPAFWVSGASGSRWRVLLPESPSREGAQCSCPDFQTRRLGTCKHVEASLAWLATHPLSSGGEGPPTVPPPSWKGIEAELDRLFSEHPPGQAGERIAFERAYRRLGREWL